MTGRSDGHMGVLVFTAYLADDIPDDEIAGQAREMDALYAELRSAGVNAEVQRPEEPPEGFRGVEPQTLLTIAIGMGQALAVNVVGDILVRWLRGSRFRRVREQRPDGTSEIGGVDPPGSGGQGVGGQSVGGQGVGGQGAGGHGAGRENPVPTGSGATGPEGEDTEAPGPEAVGPEATAPEGERPDERDSDGRPDGAA